MVNKSLDHVSPVENQGDHLSFYSGCWWVAQWWLVRDVARTKMGTSREGRDCEVEDFRQSRWGGRTRFLFIVILPNQLTENNEEPGADSDQRDEQRKLQAPIFTKPRCRFSLNLAATLVEERSNDAKTQQPGTDSDQTQAAKVQAMEIGSDVRFLAAAPVVSGFDLFWI
ncbi:hypothetical protein SO802_006851 [Lithocarpus litseifolius]|uniref:Uncharacterized protein n=1 Tax=Lithocarpus litseifolius TaxID=425828 RepID=A0AAW2DQ82_9ROSI